MTVAEVTDVMAFVLEHGAVAQQVLFADSPPASLSDEERAAIDRVKEHLKASWVGILDACRSQIRLLATDHASSGDLAWPNNYADTMWRNGEVQLYLVVVGSCRASLGFTLHLRDSGKYTLRGWVWTQAAYRQAARGAVRDLDDALEVNWDGASHWLELGVPAEGQTFDEVGADAASKLWQVARPIADAVRDAATG